MREREREREKKEKEREKKERERERVREFIQHVPSQIDDKRTFKNKYIVYVQFYIRETLKYE